MSEILRLGHPSQKAILSDPTKLLLNPPLFEVLDRGGQQEQRANRRMNLGSLSSFLLREA